MRKAIVSVCASLALVGCGRSEHTASPLPSVVAGDAQESYKDSVRPVWVKVETAWSDVNDRSEAAYEARTAAGDLLNLVGSLEPAPNELRLLHEQLTELANAVVRYAQSDDGDGPTDEDAYDRATLLFIRTGAALEE